MPDINFMKPKTEIIKENARPKPRIFAEYSKNIRGKSMKIHVPKAKITDKELDAIKQEIRSKISNSNRKRLFIRLSIVVLLLIPLYLFGQEFFKSIESGKQKEQKRAYKKRHYYIIEGYRRLKANKFYEAKWYFNKAAKIDSNNYLLQLGLARTYVKFCKFYDKDCGAAARKIQFLKDEYRKLPEIEKLAKEFAEM